MRLTTHWIITILKDELRQNLTVPWKLSKKILQNSIFRGSHLVVLCQLRGGWLLEAQYLLIYLPLRWALTWGGCLFWGWTLVNGSYLLSMLMYNFNLYIYIYILVPLNIKNVGTNSSWVKMPKISLQMSRK